MTVRDLRTYVSHDNHHPREVRGTQAASAGRRWLRTGLKLLVAAVLIGVLVYKLEFLPAPVVSHLIVPGLVGDEVMVMGTLEARLETTISPRIQEQLSVSNSQDPGSKI